MQGATITRDAATAEALRMVRETLREAKATDPTVSALRGVLDLDLCRAVEIAPGAGRESGSEAQERLTAMEAASACKCDKSTMVKFLRRRGIGEKIGGRWCVSRANLRLHRPGFLG